MLDFLLILLLWRISHFTRNDTPLGIKLIY